MMKKEVFKNILENLDRGIHPTIFEREELWKVYHFLNPSSQEKTPKVSNNEKAKEVCSICGKQSHPSYNLCFEHLCNSTPKQSEPTG